MSVLKKIGQIILRGAQIFLGIEPLLAGSVPAIATNKTFARILQIIQDVEAVGAVVGNPGLTGQQKLVAASTLISQELAAQFLGAKIKDAALFSKGATEITQGYVDVLNSLDPGAAKTENVNGGPISTQPATPLATPKP
jgi:hypothetical protein